MKLLITGGSGFLGREIVRQVYPYCSRIVIYSRDEGKHQSMAEQWPEYPDNKMRYVLGDIQNTARLTQAMKGCDHVIHAAAYKMIDKCDQRNIEQSIDTNITGTLSVVKACTANNIERAIFVSSDKACLPISAYGAEKFMGERIFISWNNFSSCRFAVVRYGNVHSSSKSVFQIWKAKAAAGEPINLTHKDMTRFFWSVEDAAFYCIARLQDCEKGCIYIPKMLGLSMADEAKKYTDKIRITGLRTLEKIHEDLINEHEAITCHDIGYSYCIYPFDHEWCENVYIAKPNPHKKNIKSGG
jgi:UDP-N-acetylglucosamine 4,6-dehydratase